MQARHSMTALIPYPISNLQHITLHQLICPFPSYVHHVMKRIELIPHHSFLMFQTVEVLIHEFYAAFVHHGQHVWEFLWVFKVLALYCFEGALGGVVVLTDCVKWGALLALDVAAEVLVAHADNSDYYAI